MVSSVDNFKDLRIWQESITLAKLVYTLADQLPEKERFGLRSQLTRACVSVASNIAEGSRRKSTKDLVHFLGIALGSLSETETQLIIAREVGFLKEEQILSAISVIDSISRGIVKLRQNLEKRSA